MEFCLIFHLYNTGNENNYSLQVNEAILNREKHEQLSDEDLLQRYLHDRNNKWLGILLPRYSLILFGVCMKYLKDEDDAKDCVQQIFFKVINEIHKYNVQHFRSWIYMVAKNACLMWIRGQKNFKVEWNENLNLKEDGNEQKQQLAEKEKILNLLQENILKLKPEQQACINYFYLQKKSYAEITTLTGFSLTQVKSYLQNGKRNLEIMMNNTNDQ